jgi:hypothetical protein
MGALGLLGAAVALILVGVGLAFGTLAAFLTVILVVAGVVSSSVAVGLLRGTARAGFRAFVVQCGVVAGVPAGMLCAWIASSVRHILEADLLWILFVGAISGAVAGACVAMLFVFIVQRLGNWAGTRLKISSTRPKALGPDPRR